MFGAVAAIGLVQALTMLVMLGRTKLLALILGPEGMGVLGVVDRLLGVLAQTAAFSLPFAAARFLPTRWGEGPGAFRDLGRRMRNVLLLSAAGVTVLGLLLTLWSPGLWGAELAGRQPVVLAGLLLVPVLIFVPFVQNVIAGALRHDLAMAFGFAYALTFTMAGVLGAYIDGLRGLYLASAVGGLALVAAVMTISERRLRHAAGLVEAASFPVRLPWPVVRFGGALLGLAFAAPFAAFYVHYLVLDRFGAAVTGWLTAAIGISYFTRQLLGQAHAVFMTPQINRAGSPAERMRWLDGYQRMFAALCAVAVPPVVLFPDLVVRLVFSDEFAPAAPLLVWFVTAEAMVLTAGGLQGLIVAQDHIGFHVVQNLAAQGLFVLVAVLLLDGLGLLGVGIAALAVPLVLLASSVLFLHYRYRLLLGVRTGLVTAWAGASIACAGVIGATWPWSSWQGAGIKATAYLVLAGVLLRLLTADDRAGIIALIRQPLALRATLRRPGR